MSALLYLLGAIVISAAAIGALTYRHRRPKSMEAAMREFERGLRALDPTSDPKRRPAAVERNPPVGEGRRPG